jgi:prevent-host-death family protein
VIRYILYETYKMSRKITTSTARAEFADILNRAAYAGERVILYRHKKPVAAVVPIEDLEILEQIEDRADLEEVRNRLKEPTIRWSKIKKELGL